MINFSIIIALKPTRYHPGGWYHAVIGETDSECYAKIDREGMTVAKNQTGMLCGIEIIPATDSEEDEIRVKIIRQILKNDKILKKKIFESMVCKKPISTREPSPLKY